MAYTTTGHNIIDRLQGGPCCKCGAPARYDCRCSYERGDGTPVKLSSPRCRCCAEEFSAQYMVPLPPGGASTRLELKAVDRRSDGQA